ncbi:hypothetical protein [Leifsonia sp. NPDC058230]|uniref:hypothetical protein n=1 Tax=Leifsonia sp. NPDC058230 TaxID=3346391 RepID=UPI0036DC79E9
MPYFSDPRREYFNGDPAAEVGSFAWTLYDDVGTLVQMRFELFPGDLEGADFPPRQGFDEFLEFLGPAWDAVLSTREEFVLQILELDPLRLGSYGLTGPELALKLASWQASRDLLTELLRRFGEGEEPQEEERPPSSRIRPAERIPWMQRIANRFPALRPILITGKVGLERADVALESLVKLAPLGDRLVELKKMVESGLGELADRME